MAFGNAAAQVLVSTAVLIASKNNQLIVPGLTFTAPNGLALL
ncbi:MULTISPECIES: hypothetical protein [unclassified Mesorhizobium]|nr:MULTISPECIES: hypothetical protein [unclassified Mesorhizobium]